MMRLSGTTLALCVSGTVCFGQEYKQTNLVSSVGTAIRIARGAGNATQATGQTGSYPLVYLKYCARFLAAGTSKLALDNNSMIS